MVAGNETDRPAGPGAGDGGKGSEAERLEARRRLLEAELATRRPVGEPQERSGGDAKGFALAVKLSSEFVAGIVVGAVLGYLLDRFAGTAPWGMIVFLLLGFGAGVLNVLRSTGAVATPRPGRRSGDGSETE